MASTSPAATEDCDHVGSMAILKPTGLDYLYSDQPRPADLIDQALDSDGNITQQTYQTTDSNGRTQYTIYNAGTDTVPFVYRPWSSGDDEPTTVEEARYQESMNPFKMAKSLGELRDKFLWQARQRSDALEDESDDEDILFRPTAYEDSDAGSNAGCCSVGTNSAAASVLPDDSISLQDERPQSPTCRPPIKNTENMWQSEVESLEFIKQLKPIHGIPHFRIELPIDREIAKANVATPWGHKIMTAEEIQLSSGAVGGGEGSGAQKGENKKGKIRDTQCEVTHNSGGGNGTGESSGTSDSSDQDPGTSGGDPSSGSETGITIPIDCRSSKMEKLAKDPENYRNGFLEIRRSELGGYGAFAVRDLECKTTILVDPILFHANDMTLYSEIDKLNGSDRRAYERLSGYVPRAGFPRLAAIFRTNCFQTTPSKQGLALVSARFNHACRPYNNVEAVWDRNQDCMVMTVSKNVQAGTELTICYYNEPSNLYAKWGFQCRCELHPDGAPDDPPTDLYNDPRF